MNPYEWRMPCYFILANPSGALRARIVDAERVLVTLFQFCRMVRPLRSGVSGPPPVPVLLLLLLIVSLLQASFVPSARAETVVATLNPGLAVSGADALTY